MMTLWLIAFIFVIYWGGVLGEPHQANTLSHLISMLKCKETNTSGVTPGCAEVGGTDHEGCWGSHLDQLSARQAPYLTSLSRPKSQQ